MRVDLVEVEAEIRKSCEIAIKNYLALVAKSAEEGNYEGVDSYSFTDEFVDIICFGEPDIFAEVKPLDDDIPF